MPRISGRFQVHAGFPQASFTSTEISMSHCQHRSVGAYVSLILRKSTKLNEVLDNWASTKVPFFSFHHSIIRRTKPAVCCETAVFLLPRNARMKGLNHLGYSDTQTLSLGNREPQHVTTNQLPLGSFSTRAGRGILTKKNDDFQTTMLSPQLLREHLRFCFVCGGGVFFFM